MTTFPGARPPPANPGALFPIEARAPQSSSRYAIGLVLLGIPGLAMVGGGLPGLEPVPVVLGLGFLTGAGWMVRHRRGVPAGPAQFLVRDDGIVIEGSLRPYNEVISARSSSQMRSLPTVRDKALWLEFADGTTIGVGPWLSRYKQIQEVVLARIPAHVLEEMTKHSEFRE